MNHYYVITKQLPWRHIFRWLLGIWNNCQFLIPVSFSGELSFGIIVLSAEISYLMWMWFFRFFVVRYKIMIYRKTFKIINFDDIVLYNTVKVLFDPWILEFVFFISFDFNFCGLIELRNPRKSTKMRNYDKQWFHSIIRVPIYILLYKGGRTTSSCCKRCGLTICS